jgi:hydroxymethylglutaryl-CoA synthase
MQRSFGIDSVGVYVPRLYVDLTGEWARVRAPALADGDVQKLVGKVTDGVGVRRMAVVDAHQDCATLAAMAAKRAIDAAGIDPRDIDYLAVGTETTVDQSKSAAAYVLGMLERHYGVSLAHVGAPQFQFACIGATYALEAALSRLRAGDAARPYSLIVASDISKYALATAGEYTQGAGAVALLVSENPRLVEIEPGLSGTVTRDERDFFRPNWSPTAVVDGKYSIDVYLDCLEGALAAYAERAKSKLGGRAVSDIVDHYLFHVPFPRMAEYAAPGNHATRDRFVAEVPLFEAGPGAGDPRTWRKEVERAAAKSPLFRETFARAVESTLTLSRDVGNMYSGSLYLALASLFEHAPASLAGRRLLFGSYGSGASAKVFSGIVSERYAEVARTLRVQDDLRPEVEGGPRVPLSVAEYERLHALSDAELDCGEGIAQKLKDGLVLSPAEVVALRESWARPTWHVKPRGASVRAPRAEFALTHLGTASSPQKTDVGYRYYSWIP